MRILIFLLLVSVGCEAQFAGTTAATIGHNTSFVDTNADGQQAFWVIGDSFAQGSNNTTGPGPTPTAGTAFYFRTSDNTIQQIGATDIPGASDGSPWPQFAIDYNASTGNKAVIIPNGIGGSEFFTSWNGTSAAYLAAKADAQDAMTAMGVTRLKWIIIICGINDARSGAPLSSINSSIGNLFYQLNVDFPHANIGVVMFGVASTGAQLFATVRAMVKEQAIAYTKVHVLTCLAPYDEWGFYGADAIHLTQTGNNFLGSDINSYIQMDPDLNKWTRSIANSYYSTLSSGRVAAIETWMNSMGSQYFDLEGYWKCKVPDKNDVFVDWALLTVPSDDGFDFTANSYITTDPTGSKAIRMNISPNNLTHRYNSGDFGIGAATYDRKGAFGTSTKYLAGASSGSSILGLAETSTGVMQYFAYDNGTTATGTGGFADNTEYAVDRIGTLKSRVVNGSVTHTETITASTVLTSGVEIGGRYTAGPSLFLNADIAYFFWYKASTWDRSVFYNANVALEASW